MSYLVFEDNTLRALLAWYVASRVHSTSVYAVQVGQSHCTTVTPFSLGSDVIARINLMCFHSFAIGLLSMMEEAVNFKVDSPVPVGVFYEINFYTRFQSFQIRMAH